MISLIPDVLVHAVIHEAMKLATSTQYAATSEEKLCAQFYFFLVSHI